MKPSIESLSTRFINYIRKSIVENKGFLVFVFFVFVTRWSFIDHYRVPTGSMIPTIQIGDHVFVNKMAYSVKLPFTDIHMFETGTPKKGDIVVFQYPVDPSINYVKRLVAVPGDKVEIHNGFLKINDRLTLKYEDQYLDLFGKLSSQEDSYTFTEVLSNKDFKVQRAPLKAQDHQISLVVPKDKYFFMGDNRDNSADSRFWGFAPKHYLMGKASRVLFSITFDGLIPHVKFLRIGKSLTSL